MPEALGSKEGTNDKTADEKMSKYLQQKLANVRRIRLRLCDPARLCCLSLCHAVMPCATRCTLKSKRNKKLWTIYQQGGQKLDTRLDLYEHLKETGGGNFSTLLNSLQNQHLSEKLKSLTESIIYLSSDDADDNILDNDLNQVT